ncbi:MAG: regulatory protein RecX [Clostridia bacterium]|nr:regulatory protein RecX [Clostridia bacterium]
MYFYQNGRRKEPPSDPEKAFGAALRTAENILAYADNSEKMLRRKLAERKYTPQIIDRVIDRLIDSGLLDERRFAENTARSLALGRLYGWSRIRARLLEKGYENAVVSSLAANGIDGVDFDANCLALFERLGGERSRENYMKMRRHGFSYENIRYAFDAFANTES